MKQLLLTIALLLATACVTQAQTATFNWTGSTASSQPVELANVNGVPVNQSIGYSGEIQVVNGSFLWLLDLPESLGFPNNGFLDCGSAALLTYGVKSWGVREDGTEMNGTQAGDYYDIPATTSCSKWGTVSISVTFFHEMVAHRYCRYGVCKTQLIDTIESGFGSATVE